MSTNGALRANGNTFDGGAQDTITSHGSNWYFAVCGIMAVATLAFLGLSATKPRKHRIFYYITSAITMVATIAYFTMGSGLGWVPIDVEFPRNSPNGLTREIFYVRYIDWVITTPLLLMDLLLTAGMPWPTILFVILVDEVMIIAGLIGALVRSSYKWGYFFIGMLALFYILYHLCFASLRHAGHFGADVKRVFLTCGALTSVLWTLYPIAWGLCEGGNILSTNQESWFYGVLDLFAKVGFGTLLLFGHRNIDPRRLGLHIRDYEDMDFDNVEKHHTGTTGVHSAVDHTHNNTGVTGTTAHTGTGLTGNNAATTCHTGTGITGNHGTTTIGEPMHTQVPNNKIEV